MDGKQRFKSTVVHHAISGQSTSMRRRLEYTHESMERDQSNLWVVTRLLELCRDGVLFAVWPELGVKVSYKTSITSDLEYMSWVEAVRFVNQHSRKPVHSECLAAKDRRETA